MAGSPAFEQLDVAGRTVEVLTQGRGRPLVYLHAGDGIEPSLGFIERLARSFKVIAPSHPGFGASPRHGLRDIHDLAYHTLDLLETLELEAPVVAGSSFGGWIAAEMAVRAPARLGGLVLIDAVGIKTGGPEDRNIVDIFSHTPEALNALSYNRPPPMPAPADLAAALRIASNRESLSRFAWSPTLHNPRLRRWLHRITTPTLVVWGADDRIVAPDYGRAYAQGVPGARFELIEDAGHYPQREQPEAVARAVEAFAGVAAAVPA
ncbi:alpha/beta hydrolase [Phenylobacterium sp.]|jgi:pimeloyl-ACP methyl ester carboxylesterase|uniref:alpha/beta fold hydrolase n=1 Tax=Phenylobacterium sp. TaxID=1871053 RepID=UPI002F3F51B7